MANEKILNNPLETKARESHSLESRYFTRMAAGLGDKLAIVENLPPVTLNHSPKVLDVGAGGGEFSHALQELGYTVIALDASDDAIMRMRKSFPTLTTVKMLANQAVSLGDESFDAVVCSSILHEVYSYGDDHNSKGSKKSIFDALKAFYKIIKPGGKLIIRDGVKPEDHKTKARVRLISGDSSAVYSYLDQCPFANGFIPGSTGRLIQLEEDNSGWFTGSLQSAFEFYMTYNWGVENYKREAQELFGVFTLKEYQEALAKAGFDCLKAESWVQEGYLKHLPQKVELEVSGVFNEWPATNALWVAEKL